jgi:predicted MFS family arabinose efflux permease
LASTESAAAPLFSKAYRAWLLTMLLLTNAFNLADRQQIAAVAQAIKQDLRLTDSEMGMILGLGYAILYTLLGLPIARLAEHRSRAKIVAVSLAVFGAMAALCSTAQSFWRLLLFRVGVGVGDAGFGPPVASLIGDHYPQEKRASVMSIIWLGAPIGVVSGSFFGGWMAEHVSWRAAFIAIGSPALLVAVLAFVTLKEPPRGMSDRRSTSSAPPPSTWTVLKFLMAKPSMRHILIGCGLAATAMNAIGQYLGQFLVRNYPMGLATAGALLGTLGGAAMASGLALGGFGVDWAGRFDKRWYVWGPAIGLVLSAPAFALGFNQPTLVSTIAVLMAGHIVLFIYYTPTLALAQNMVGASMRASSAFAVSVFLGLVGIGLGPTLVGALSDLFARHAFSLGEYSVLCANVASGTGGTPAPIEACNQASAVGVRQALTAMSLLFVWAAVHYLLAARSLRRDLETHYEPGPQVAAT